MHDDELLDGDEQLEDDELLWLLLLDVGEQQDDELELVGLQQLEELEELDDVGEQQLEELLLEELLLDELLLEELDDSSSSTNVSVSAISTQGSVVSPPPVVSSSGRSPAPSSLNRSRQLWLLPTAGSPPAPSAISR